MLTFKEISHTLIYAPLLTISLLGCLELPESADANVIEDSANDDTDSLLSNCNHGLPNDYSYISGQSYFSDNNWIEYIPGTLPIIISAPHGGELTPDSVPIFNDGLARDGGSQKYARAVAQYLYQHTGHYPHLIINHLTRNRLNLNRSQEDDNFENIQAMTAWMSFHDYINDAKNWVNTACEKGLYLDFHTNGHDHGFNELGYLLSREQLNLSNAEINALSSISSLLNLTKQDNNQLTELLHGPFSLGKIMNNDYEVMTIPNAVDIPFAYSYFNGGYNTRTHGSRDGGAIDGIQIESHFNYVNSGESTRLDYAKKLASAIQDFVEHWYQFELNKD